MDISKIFRNKSVFLKLFVSYLLLLTVTLIVEMSVFLHVLHTGREQAQALNRSLMLLVKNECDNQIRDSYRCMDLLAFNDMVQSLSVSRGASHSDDPYMAYRLYGELRDLLLTSEDYEMIYVYFTNTDSVISSLGNMSLEMYHSIYYKDTDISLEELRSYLRQKHYHDTRAVFRDGKTAGVMYTMTSLKTDVGEQTATIVIQVTPHSIDRRIRSAQWNEAVQVAVLNSRNEFLNVPSFPESIQDIRYEDLSADENLSFELNGEAYMGIAMKSGYADWIYVLLAPGRIVEGSARQMAGYCVAGLGVCLVLGFFCAWWMTRRNYGPVRSLVELFRGQREESDTRIAKEIGNEFVWLEYQTRKFFSEHDNMRDSLSTNQQRLKEFYLYKLLMLPYVELEAAEKELLDKCGIGDGVLRVVLLSAGIPPGKEDQGTQSEMTQELKRFIIKNVAEEALNSVFPTEVFEAGSDVAALIHLAAMDKENYDRMWQTLSDAHDLIRENFHFYMQVCAGTAKEGIENVHLSYQEAKEAEEYAALLETYFINYNDVKNRGKKYHYPKEADTVILHAVTSVDPEPAISCVREILRTNYRQNHISAGMLTFLVYDLLGVFIRAADEAGCGDFFEQEWMDAFWEPAQKTPAEVEAQFERMIQSLCNEVVKVKSKGDTQLADRLERYVLENFRDPDLNISQTALCFDMTPAYISSMYKKQTGRGLLKFITQTRIDEAVRLLEQGMPVNEVALLSGFRDSRSFIRVFKKHTGVTPGQLKKE